MWPQKLSIRLLGLLFIPVFLVSCGAPAPSSPTPVIPTLSSVSTPTQILPTPTLVSTATQILQTLTPTLPPEKPLYATKLGVDVPLRIMPMGDSITEGVCDTEANCNIPFIKSPGQGDGVASCSWSLNPDNPKAIGYRVFLRDKIAAKGLEMIYVGSTSVVEGLSHEGHSAWTITDLDYCVQNGEWLEKGKPNVILLHIGTNDANSARTPDEMAASLQTLLEHIYAKLPETTEVIVAQIIPAKKENLPLFVASSTLMNDIISPFNEKIPGIVENLQAQKKHVTFVDMTGAIHSEGELDAMMGLHPNPEASERMADVWLAKILEVIGQKP